MRCCGPRRVRGLRLRSPPSPRRSRESRATCGRAAAAATVATVSPAGWCARCAARRRSASAALKSENHRLEWGHGGPTRYPAGTGRAEHLQTTTAWPTEPLFPVSPSARTRFRTWAAAAVREVRVARADRPLLESLQHRITDVTIETSMTLRSIAFSSTTIMTRASISRAWRGQSSATRARNPLQALDAACLTPMNRPEALMVVGGSATPRRARVAHRYLAVPSGTPECRTRMRRRRGASTPRRPRARTAPSRRTSRSARRPRRTPRPGARSTAADSFRRG